MTAEEFITQPSTAEKSPYEKIQELLAEKLNVPQNYVAIFSVMNGKNYEYTEIRYAAHGSPWYPASKLDGIITLDKAEVGLWSLRQVLTIFQASRPARVAQW